MPRPRRSRRPSPALGARRGLPTLISAPPCRFILVGKSAAVVVSALRRRHLFLHDIPMFGDLAIGDAEDIHSHHRFRSPSEIAAVNGDIVALRHNETWLIPEVGRKVSQERLDCSGTVRNLRVVLLIVIAEQAVENGGITI